MKQNESVRIEDDGISGERGVIQQPDVRPLGAFEGTGGESRYNDDTRIGAGGSSATTSVATDVDVSLSRPTFLPTEPQRKAVQASSSTGSPRNQSGAVAISCAVCQTECSTARVCTTCGSFLHHFCSHDVCVSLKIRGSDGQLLSDFGDDSYCSKLCYEKMVSSVGVASRGPQADRQVLLPPSFDHGTSVSAPYFPCSEPVVEDTTPFRPCVSSSETAVISTTTQGRESPRQKKSTGSDAKNKTTQREKTPTCGGGKHKKAPLKKKSDAKKTKAARKTESLQEELSHQLHLAAGKFMNARVAFSPEQEVWMNTKHYEKVGGSFLVGVVSRYSVTKKRNTAGISVPTAKYEIRWINTAFQTKHHVHHVDESVVYRGVRQFVAYHKNSIEFGESWSSLCNIAPKFTDVPALIEDFEEIDDSTYREILAYRGEKDLQIDLFPAEVETIQGMTFSPVATLDPVPGLFTHADGRTTTKLCEDSKKWFGRSATMSFFAFLPLSLWKQVVVFSNGRAVATETSPFRPIELDELMKFLGILWYMALIDKGEMRNYWVDDEEASIFPEASTNLSKIMSWRRFLFIRRYLAFRAEVSPAELKRDPAAKIRPVISMLKRRCNMHVIPGRNVAVDEASIACRSKYARHIIVYNPRKPTGKYHFKLYVCCCSTTWLVLSFKLHCASRLEDRLSGVVRDAEISRLAALTEQSSDVRKHVLEVTSSLQGSRRVVNTDNFYMSCMLLESLRTVGLFGRGTVRSSSKHFPRYAMIQPGDEMTRGSMKQGVCSEKHIVAASWVDGSIVNVISNADDSGTTTVFRQIKQARVPFQAPSCVSHYDAAMQGVDRHDQLRGRFSVAGGHSFKKWYKKMGLAMIDIARCNAYICHELASKPDLEGQTDLLEGAEEGLVLSGRDKHRAFVAALVREMFDGSWKASLSDDNDGILYSESSTTVITRPNTGASSLESTAAVLPGVNQLCVARESWIALNGRSRSARECSVCRFEGRVPTQKTDYCEQHKVALCKRTYAIDPTKPHLCQDPTWSCWQKYHRYYLIKQVYNSEGRLMRGSPIYRAQAQFLKEKNNKRVQVTTTATADQPQ